MFIYILPSHKSLLDIFGDICVEACDSSKLLHKIRWETDKLLLKLANNDLNESLECEKPLDNIICEGIEW